MGALETLRSCTDCWETGFACQAVGGSPLLGGGGGHVAGAAGGPVCCISAGHKLLSCPAKGLESVSPARMRTAGHVLGDGAGRGRA